MSEPVDPHLLMACCRSYAFIALDQYDVLADTYRLRWIDPALIHRRSIGSLAYIVQAMATSCDIRVPAPDATQSLGAVS